MTTRSRTSLFLSYRNSRPRALYHDNNDENEHLITASHLVIDLPDLPPTWVDYADRVQELLLDTHTKIASLDKLHAKHVLPGFSDRSHEEREIEALTTDITKDFRHCQSLINKISAPQSHAFPPDHKKSRHEDLTAKNVQRGLAAKVQDLSAAFRKKQRVYMEKIQGHAIKNQDLLLASGAISLKGSDGMSEVDDDVQAATHTRAQSQSLVHVEPSLELHSRDRELTEIAKSIASLAELFKDLSVLVIDQGTLLDSVEYNIEQTAVQVEEAVEELNVATKYQKNTGRRKCIFLLLLIIFGLVVVLLFKPKKRGTSSPIPLPSSPSSQPIPDSSNLRFMRTFTPRPRLFP
ncbi:syntaxin-like t-SNARE protein TLG2 [Laccaria bicolor S238N-H82]|uniref:Syntaxin-like t-SNARE protein TLG2 n=1 Tax=Laccaria bicolor (strain S238N-H82 / ATCC MYA-4686) TaxID=486041 RepID=B0D0I5_LACBS|nr:syntaxin-like t-SNARE protein TLG2 [Laccaria bicolor S238N-H82]EDR11467.1 syntaxin-like t-SNARE protein TLG2 [Laccaria bicolor S238N-H82]|eukprot:XP_001877364.1 syntaxin-like t-SNARE protein TLG2 [Laccaria bicolor S238N-H82]